MTFEEGLKLTGSPVEIPECNRETLPAYLKANGFLTGAEIGVYKGDYSAHFAKAGLKHFAIDPWMAFPGQGRTQQVQERQDFLFGHAGRTLAPYPNCTIIRKTSMEAVKDFADESLDYVYIDGDHEYSHIVEDVTEWAKKVRKGGIVAGHDYWDTDLTASNVICHGKSALDYYTNVHDIKNWFIYGKMFPLEEQKKDNKYHSWLFIKE